MLAEESQSAKKFRGDERNLFPQFIARTICGRRFLSSRKTEGTIYLSLRCFLVKFLVRNGRNNWRVMQNAKRNYQMLPVFVAKLIEADYFPE